MLLSLTWLRNEAPILLLAYATATEVENCIPAMNVLKAQQNPHNTIIVIFHSPNNTK
jgi:hypothetical protein